MRAGAKLAITAPPQCVVRRPPAGLKPGQIELKDLLAGLASEFGVLARERGVVLAWQPTQAWVASDAALLRRVLQNFLSNAVRLAARGKVLTGTALKAELGLDLPAIVISADHSEAVRAAVEAAGCRLLHKPLKPPALKSLMARLV